MAVISRDIQGVISQDKQTHKSSKSEKIRELIATQFFGDKQIIHKYFGL